MEIKLKSIHISNWKGISSFSCDFSNLTYIYGANRAGKTTIKNAILWTLFGKDANDKKDFEIKPYNSKGIPAKKQEHEVTLVLDQDGSQIVLRRVFKEKWTKRRQSAELVYEGNETEFFINDVPMQLKEYQSYIGNIVPEDMFKILTSPHYFSTMHWTDRREILQNMAGKIDEQTLIQKDEDFAKLLQEMSGKDAEMFRKELKAKLKAINEEIETIEPRIQENSRSIKPDEDEAEIGANIAELKAKRQTIESQILDISNQYKEIEKRKSDTRSQIAQLKDKIDDIKRKARNDFEEKLEQRNSLRRKKLSEIADNESRIGSLKSSILMKQQDRDKLIGEVAKLRQEYTQTIESQFEYDDKVNTCPVCKQEFPNIDKRKETLRHEFNASKVNTLKHIEQQGVQLAIERDKCISDLRDLNEKLNTSSAILDKLKQEIPEQVTGEFNLNQKQNDSITAIEQQVLLLQDTVDDTLELFNVDDLKVELANIDTSISEQRERLHVNRYNHELSERIAELERMQKALGVERARLETLQDIDKRMNLAIAEITESRVASLFEQVWFKMYDVQVNGELNPTCTAMLNGVPYDTLNYEGQYTAGIDIIKALQKHYDTRLPILIDNRESVTELPIVDCQVINFEVNPNDKKLRVETY
jgi:exonuclease SbcC